MKRVIGGILLFFGIIAGIYTLYLGVFALSCVAGVMIGVGVVLLGSRDITVVKSEVKEEDGVFRLHVTVKNNQKRATGVAFVANIYYRGASIGVVNSNSLLLDELGTGELVAVLPRPSKETRKEEITWSIVKWNYS